MNRFYGEYIGLDIGSVNSLAAFMDGIAKQVFCSLNPEGGFLVPSCVQFETADKYVVGKVAKETAVLAPSRTVEDFKKNMGKNIVEIEIEGKKFYSRDIWAILLERVVRMAEEELETKIKGVVLPVPVSFGDAARQDVINAGKKIGLEKVVLVEESTISLYYHSSIKDLKGKVCMLDLGGCTFDITVANVSKDVIDILHVDGDGQCGGRDFDQCFLEYIKGKFLKGKTLSEYDEYLLKENVEKAKHALSNKAKTRILIHTDEGNQSEVLTREDFEECTKLLMNRLKAKLLPLKDMKIEKIFFVGGATKMPQFRKMVEEVLPGITIISKNPEEAVARGAAVYAQMLYDGEKVHKVRRLQNISTHSYGIAAQLGTNGEKKVCHLIKKGMSLPVKMDKVFYTGEENQKNVNLKVYEGDSCENFSKLESESYLGTACMEMKGNLPKYTKIVASLKLDENGILLVEGIEPQTNCFVKVTMDTGGKAV